MAGLRLRPGLLAEDGWGQPAGAAAGFARLRTLMHVMIPHVYDVAHLERLGGRFALRVAGGANTERIGDFRSSR